MELGDIREEVKVILADPGISDDTIDSYINETYLSTVARCLVPELKGMDVVTTSTTNPYVSLSAVDGGFSGVLSRVYSSLGEKIRICRKMEDLMDFGPLDEAGDVRAVALEGSVLWYKDLPETAVDLTLIYYKNPETLVEGDSPSFIPDFLHRQVLVNGACAIAYDLFEDAIDGQKVNFQSRTFMCEQGIIKFMEWLSKTRRHYIYPQRLG